MGLACFPKEPALHPTVPAKPKADKNALRVSFAAPQGNASSESQISIVMSRPMRALTQAGHEPPSFATLNPEVLGQWHWIGTQALQFQPTSHLPRATSFHVHIPAGTKALDGKTLAEPFDLKFETARPKAVRIEPRNESRGLGIHSQFTLHFNQPIEANSLKQALQFTARPSSYPPGSENSKDNLIKSIEFEIQYPDPQNPSVLTLVPKTALPKASEIHLSIANTLQGKEGPLTAQQKSDFRFHTHGSLEVLDIQCDKSEKESQRCEASTPGMDILLSNPISEEEARANISIDPPIPFEILTAYENEGQGIAVLAADWEHSKSYQIKIRAGLRDKHGEVLAREYQNTLQMGPRRPQMIYGFTGSVFVPSDFQDITIVSVNKDEFSLAYALIDEQGLLKLLKPQDPDQPSDWNSLSPDSIGLLPGGAKKIVNSKTTLNHPFVFKVPPKDLIDPATKIGAFALSYTDKFRDYEQHRSVFIQSTDLAIGAKLSHFGSLARLTRLSTGEPVSGARLSIVNPAKSSKSIEFISDSNGFVLIPKERFKPDAYLYGESSIFIARLGKEWAFWPVNQTLSARDAWASLGEPPPIGLLFSERRLYRPGETAHIKGIVRNETRAGTDKQSRIPSGQNIQIQLTGEDRKPLDKRQVPISRFGTFSFDVPIPKGASLGYVRAEAELGGESMQLDPILFEIGEYRPNEIAVQARAVRDSYVNGEQASFQIHAESYSGMPQAGQSVNIVSWREQDESFRPAGLADTFSIDDKAFSKEKRSRQKSLLARTSVALNAFGDGKFDAMANIDGQIGPERLVCSAEVGDDGGQPVASRASTLVHPAEFYVALRRGAQGYVKAGSDIHPEVLAIDPRGNTISNVPVRIELYERTYEENVRNYYRYQAKDTLISSCELKTQPRAESCALSAKNGGFYILRAVAASKTGRPIAASQSVYVASSAFSSHTKSGQSTDLDLIADRMHYKIGDTAKILVQSPFEKAQALITVERAGIYEKRLVQLSGPSPTVDIPITQEMWPNAFVSVLLTQPVQKNKGPAPAYRFGVLPISLLADENRLALTLKTDKSEVLPGAPVSVDIEVRDSKGKGTPSELTVYAVDMGVISLTDEKRPDPLAVFAEPRLLGVATVDSRDALGQFLSPEEALGQLGQVRMGAGSGSLGARERKDFRPTAYYNPSLLTNAQGKAKITFSLPDSLSSYRIVAVAVQEGDKMGSAETMVRTGQDLMIRPAVPRFLRAGDAVSAGAVISSRLAGSNEIEFEIQSDGLDVIGESKKRISLGKDQSQEVRFLWKANRIGKARLRMSARAIGQKQASDALSIERDIQLPLSLERVALYGQTTALASEKIGPLSDVRGDAGGLTVELENSPLVGLSASAEQVWNYPYACTEQLTSRVVASAALKTLSGIVNTPAAAEASENQWLAQIEAAQRADGAFGFWRNSPGGEPFVTAYALLGLSLAKQHKMPVRDAVFNKAVEFLRDWLNYRSESPYAYAEAVFVADALAEAEIAMQGRVNSAGLPKWIHNIVRQRKGLSPSSLAMLLGAAKKAGNAAADEKELSAMSAELEAFIRLDGPNARVIEALSEEDGSLLDSSARTQALVLRALITANPAHPLGDRLVKGLLSDRNASGWKTTQENAWALLALSEYARRQERADTAYSGVALLSGKELGRVQFENKASSARFQAPIGLFNEAQSLDIRTEGKGPVFYSATLAYAPAKMPVEPLERGFFIQRMQRAVRVEHLMEAVSAAPSADQQAFEQGDLILTDLLVVVPTPRDHLVVEDPLPAGLEPVNTAFATTSEWLAMALSEAKANTGERSPYARAWYREELRDDKALFFMEHAASGIYRFQYLARASSPGDFHRPPAMAQAMYSPEIFGRSAASRTHILPKTTP